MSEHRIVKLRVREDIARELDKLGVDLERACLEGLALIIYRHRRAAEWKEEHRDALEAYNHWFEEKGTAILDRLYGR